MNKMKYALITAMALFSGASLFADVDRSMEKNLAQVEYRTLPADYENLPFRETEKWNFGFRPYGAEAASVLWSDPKVIRSVSSGERVDEQHLATALYVSCDQYGLNILGYGALRDQKKMLEKGANLDNVYFECFFLPGDSDTPPVINYQPFGISTLYPYLGFKLSWMKQDRNNRDQFKDMRVEARLNSNGVVLRSMIPWHVIWDRLPVFPEKRDNFWRLSMIRWGGSNGRGETWGGRVHSQTKCGLIRMPDFTSAQKAAIMKTTLETLWTQYQNVKNSTPVNPAKTFPLNQYRKSIDSLPHTWMNVNEDPDFKENVLIPLIKDRDQIGAEFAKFDTMSVAEQQAFYLKNAPLLANFAYDVDEAYSKYLKTKMMKH